MHHLQPDCVRLGSYFEAMGVTPILLSWKDRGNTRSLTKVVTVGDVSDYGIRRSTGYYTLGRRHHITTFTGPLHRL